MLVARSAGPCSVCPVVLANEEIPDGSACAVFQNSQNITVMANGAGTCHVELTFASGATSSVDLDFTSVWIGCGSDPHGCGEGFVAVAADGGPEYTVSVADPMCDAGITDAQGDAPSDTAVDAVADAGAGG